MKNGKVFGPNKFRYYVLVWQFHPLALNAVPEARQQWYSRFGMWYVIGKHCLLEFAERDKTSLKRTQQSDSPVCVAIWKTNKRVSVNRCYDFSGNIIGKNKSYSFQRSRRAYGRRQEQILKQLGSVQNRLN